MPLRTTLPDEPRMVEPDIMYRFCMNSNRRILRRYPETFTNPLADELTQLSLCTGRPFQRRRFPRIGAFKPFGGTVPSCTITPHPIRIVREALSTSMAVQSALPALSIAHKTRSSQVDTGRTRRSTFLLNRNGTTCGSLMRVRNDSAPFLRCPSLPVNHVVRFSVKSFPEAGDQVLDSRIQVWTCATKLDGSLRGEIPPPVSSKPCKTAKRTSGMLKRYCSGTNLSADSAP